MENWSDKNKDVKQGKYLNIVELYFKFNQILYPVTLGGFFGTYQPLLIASITIFFFHCFFSIWT